ncbi:hypothetical protein MMC18_001597 [Xylographa bjoerkii]|nr:hypothetical protein [Xylographa bjoerkii]
MDPGTALAVVSLALEAVKELYDYYKVWKDCDNDVLELRSSLLWLAQVITAMEATLRKPPISGNIASMIVESVNACKTNMLELEIKLSKVKKDGSTSSCLAKLKAEGRQACYPFRKKSVTKLANLIEVFKSRLSLMADLLNLDLSATSLERMRSIDSRLTSIDDGINQTKILLRSGAIEKDREAILEWLGAINHSSFHDATFTLREPETGAWLLKIGCGKTVLCSSIIENVKKAGGLLLFFYFSFRDSSVQPLAALLRSFISQLCPPDYILPQLRQVYNECRKIYPPKSASTSELQALLLSILQDKREKHQELERSEACFIMKDGRESLRRGDVYIIVDALDEIPFGPQRDKILDLFQILTTLDIPYLHMLMTTRYCSDIRSMLVDACKWDLLPIKQSVVERDIRTYVDKTLKGHSRLARLVGRSTTMKKLIDVYLVQQSGGMFRWTCLQLESLERLKIMTQTTVERVLKSLPKDLDETYERILANVDAALAQEARKALRLIAFSCRPLLIEEVAEVCTIDYESTPPFDEQQRFDHSNVLILLQDLVSVEPSISDVSEMEAVPRGKHFVLLAHFSVLEYLTTSRKISAFYNFETKSSHMNIAATCLAYLSHCNTLAKKSHVYPLRDYAWNFWAKHTLSSVEEDEHRISQRATELFNQLTHFSKGDASPQDILKQPRKEIGDVLRLLPDSSRNRLWDAIRTPFFYEEFTEEDYLGYRQNNYSTLVFKHKFEYTSLGSRSNTIRLIDLFPASDQFEEIRCMLFEVELDEQVPYEALSYTWGPDYTTRTPIRLNGYTFLVSQSLGTILRELRNMQKAVKRRLWIDAICINQEDMTDRVAQVQLMRKIYTQAQSVTVHLDTRLERDRSAIEFAKDLSTALTDTGRRTENLVAFLQTCVSTQYRESWNALLGLIKRKWWTRIWTIQEALTGNIVTLTYGEFTLDYEIIVNITRHEDLILEAFGRISPDAKTFIQKEIFDDPDWKRVAQVMELRPRYLAKKPPRLPEVLTRTRFHTSTVRLDLLISILSLVSDDEKHHELLAIDYSIPWSEQFERIARYILTAYPNLDIFSYMSCCAITADFVQCEIPSWIPNFSSPSPVTPLVWGVFGGPDQNDLFCAGGTSPSRIHFRGERQLVVRGVKVDEVILRYDQDETGAHDTEVAQVTRRLRALRLAEKRRLQTADAEASAVAPMLDISSPEAPTMVPHDASRDRLLSNGTPLQIEEGRRYFRTMTGGLGLGPAECDVSDIIVVALGGKVPYVLRCLDNSGKEKQYRLIGECYVEGIMNGEALELDPDFQDLVLV